MRFTGQVRVPEVDHPGIPATIVVEDGLAEVLLEGESLGRWSLYDVHAARLVSSAFSISLGGEEITFIADEPVDFAYKGVEHMAGVWARYKSMTIPRRVVAVGRSRRGTTPSRIPELREAMLLNLHSAGSNPPHFSPADAASPAEVEPSPWAKRLDAYSNVPEPVDDLSGSVLDHEPVTETESIEPAVAGAVSTETETTELEPTALESTGPAAAESDLTETDDALPADLESDVEDAPDPGRAAPLRPGPGLIPRQVVRAPEATSSHSAEPPDWELAWEEPPTAEEPYEELPHDAALVFAEAEPPRDDSAPRDEAGDAIIEEPAVVGAPPATNDETNGRRDVVLDLENFEVETAPPAPAPSTEYESALQSMVEPDLELLFAGAPAPEGERSGLFGAVRSAFARNRGGTHEHEFVEAPGGIGIVRQICADCGYISIGVSD